MSKLDALQTIIHFAVLLSSMIEARKTNKEEKNSIRYEFNPMP